MTFSYDGHRLAAVGRHGEIRVWACVPRTDNLTSENLRLSDAEVEFLERLLPLVPTPRGAKRLVNVYRILRAPLRGEDIERLVGVNGRQPEHPAVLLLFAIVTGFPEQANEIIEGLLDRPAPTWREFLETFQQKRVDEPRTPEEAIWARFFERLDDIKAEGIPNDIRTYVEWTPRVACYSFRTGRLAKQRGAIEQ